MVIGGARDPLYPNSMVYNAATDALIVVGNSYDFTMREGDAIDSSIKYSVIQSFSGQPLGFKWAKASTGNNEEFVDVVTSRDGEYILVEQATN